MERTHLYTKWLLQHLIPNIIHPIRFESIEGRNKTFPLACRIIILRDTKKNKKHTMAWFKRKDKNIQTEQRKEMPEGVWIKVPTTGETVHRRELEDNLWVDPLSGYHFRIGSDEYFSFLFDKGKFNELG